MLVSGRALIKFVISKEKCKSRKQANSGPSLYIYCLRLGDALYVRIMQIRASHQISYTAQDAMERFRKFLEVVTGRKCRTSRPDKKATGIYIARTANISHKKCQADLKASAFSNYA